VFVSYYFLVVTKPAINFRFSKSSISINFFIYYFYICMSNRCEYVKMSVGRFLQHVNHIYCYFINLKNIKKLIEFIE